MNRLLHDDFRRPQPLSADDAAPEQSPTLVEQFGLRHLPTARLCTGQILSQQVARVAPAVTPTPAVATDAARPGQCGVPHAICSAEILHEFESLRELVPLVLHHHENFDGSGYPYGLSGASIPRGARIIRVAETYTALLRAQPYRPALTAPEALATLQAGAGTQFDPASVAALAACLERGMIRDEVLECWRRERPDHQ